MQRPGRPISPIDESDEDDMVEKLRSPAAVESDATMSTASAEDLRRLPLAKIGPSDLTTDALTAETDSEVANVLMISDRKDEDGQIWYLVKWTEVEDEEGRYQWVTSEACSGESQLKYLVDARKASAEELEICSLLLPSYETIGPF
ncbi:hypothetical protein PsorP6_012972 [Peronosclerospora sorghi]|uniref:Uncharacterized protein n=1 Tax=Peronosclerospora sorghi TaxID=230839 RepID=A0ACC0WIP2_9STRA|nr:hypothetical protein PsorP6_012972 [Peronosclerospora sorghi]